MTDNDGPVDPQDVPSGDPADELPPPVFPEPEPPAPPVPPGPAPAPPTPQYAAAYPEGSQATTVLVLGILSIVFCQILGPFAWSMGNKELQAIDAGRRPPENRSNANAGRIMGIIGTVLLGLGILAFVGFFLIAILATAANA